MRVSVSCVLLVVGVLLLLAVAGCGKPAEQGTTPAAGSPAKPGELAGLEAAYKMLTSYKVTLTVNGQSPATDYVKLQDGAILVQKHLSGAGWTMDDLIPALSYIYDGKGRSVIKRGLTTKFAEPDFRQLASQYPQVSEGVLDGAPCLIIDRGAGQAPPNKLWIDKQYGLVRQDVSEGTTIKHTYSMINAVPESEFHVPPDFKIVEDAPAPRQPATVPGRAKAQGGQPPYVPTPLQRAPGSH